MKKVMKIVCMIILIIIAMLAAAFVFYWYRYIHWYDEYEKALDKVEAEEKQVTLPNGNIINYGEVKNDKPALLLIHGQMSIWEDYALVLPELSKNWHIYAVGLPLYQVIPMVQLRQPISQHTAVYRRQRLIVLSDDQEGIALVPAEVFEARMRKAMNFASIKSEE